MFWSTVLDFNHSTVMLLVRAPFLRAEEECRLPSMVRRLQSMGKEWKKPWGLGPSERKSHRENHGSSSAMGRGRRSLLYVAQELHVQGESAAWSCVRTRPECAVGPSPNCSCSWAVIWRDVWGAVNISIYKTWNWKPLVYYFTQCFSSGNIPLKNLFSLVCHSVIIRYYFYEAFGHRIMQCLCKHFSAFFVNIWVEHVGIFSSPPPLLTFII